MQPQSMNSNPAQPAGTPVPVRRAAPAGGAAAPAASAPEPTFDNGPSVVGGKGNRKTGWILAIILLLLIAAGGVGFGVWMWIDGNTQKEVLNNQISSLQQTNSELQEQINNDVVDGRINPVILPLEDGVDYKLLLQTSNVFPAGEENGKYLYIMINADGDVSCVKSATDGSSEEECLISGLEGDVYKMVEFGGGQNNIEHNIGFIMTDGTVYYLPLYDAVENNNFDIRGTVKVDGNVVDIVDVGFTPTEPGSGGLASIFVLDDGTFVRFDKTMLNQQ